MGRKPPPTPAAERLFAASASATALFAGAARASLPPQSRLTAHEFMEASSAGFAINIISVLFLTLRFGHRAWKYEFPWPTLVSPAGFAFAICVIYLERLRHGGVTTAAVSTAVHSSSVAWLCANVAQCLWCASFRPWALERLWLSSACLAATAYCLVVSQLRLLELRTRTVGTEAQAWQWALVVMPRSLHAGWVTAATLVNLNAWAGKAAIGASAAHAAAILSLLSGVSLGDYYASRGLLLSAAAVSWALFAVSKGEPVGRDAQALSAAAIGGFAQAAAGGAALIALSMASSRLMTRMTASAKDRSTTMSTTRPLGRTPRGGTCASPVSRNDELAHVRTHGVPGEINETKSKSKMYVVNGIVFPPRRHRHQHCDENT